MRKKVLASVMLGILLVFNICSPIASAVDSIQNTPAETTTQPSTPEGTKVELGLDIVNGQTGQAVTGAQVTVSKADTTDKVDTWSSTGEEKKLSLEAGQTYTVTITPDATYQPTTDMTVKVDADGKVYQKSETGDWTPLEGNLKVALQPVVETPDTDTSGQETDSTEPPTTPSGTQILKVTLPQINVYNSANEDDNFYPASFRLRKEGDTKDIALWMTGDEQPTVSLEVGTVYTIEEFAVYKFEDAAEPAKIRLKSDGTFEQQINGEWTATEIFKIAIKKITRSRRVARAAINGVVNPDTITDGDIAPLNLLQIVQKMPQSSKVTIIEQGARFGTSWRVSAPAYTQLSNRMHAGQYNQSENNQLDPNIADAAGDHAATIIRFQPSRNPGNWGNDYQTNPNTGWNPTDLNMDTSEMWVKVWYHDAAYYNGELVDAVATIKVTPYKNRTPNSGDQSQYSTQPYYPMIQISDILFGGWTWQNVNKFNVDITFHRQLRDQYGNIIRDRNQGNVAKINSNPIPLPEGDLTSKSAAYYTINSLDPLRTEGDWDRPRAVYGPESVKPADGTTSGAYVVPGTNIVTSYNGGPNGVQTAYNGGSTLWGTAAGRKEQDDVPGKPNWSKNSVLFTTAATDHINVTLGNLERNPQYQKVPRTNYVWATISTEAFTNNIVKYIDIPIQKTWNDPDNPHQRVEVELYATWRANGKDEETSIQTQVLGPDNNWQTVFKQVPDQESLVKLIKKFPGSENATNVQYRIREKTVPGYKPNYTGDINGFAVRNDRVESEVTIAKNWKDSNGRILSNEETRDLGPIKVRLKRKVGNSEDTSFNKEVELRYHADANQSWKATVGSLPIKNSRGIDYTYFIVEDENSLPKSFSIEGYTKSGTTLSVYGSRNQLGVTNKRTKTSLTITKIWQDNNGNIANPSTKDFGILKVTLKRKVGSTVDKNFNQEITLSYNQDTNKSWKATVDGLEVKNDAGKNYNYFIEEDVTTIPDHFYIVGYDKPNGIQLSDNPTSNQLTVTNKRNSVEIIIRKLWYDKDNHEIANDKLPKELTVKLYRTTDGSATGGELVETIKLTRTNVAPYTWQTSRRLPLRSKDGKQYYSYYIEEDKPQGYLEISEKNQKQLINTSSNAFTQTNATMTLKNKVNPVYPSTGGFGNLPYISIGLLSLFMASIIYIMQKKKGI